MADGEMKRILILNGSPHRNRSTTMTATNAFVGGILSSGGYEAETLHIADLRITPCTGCLSCWGRTEGECVIKNDDIPAVKEKLLSADILILSFPLYFFGIPGQMKLMADRLLSVMGTYAGRAAPRDGSPAHEYRYPRPSQKTVLISGCAYTETDVVYNAVREQADLIFGRGGYTAIYCPQLKTMADKGGARLDRALGRFTEAGKEFAENGALSDETLRAVTRPPFSREIYRTVLEGVWRAEREKGGNL